MPGVFLPPNTNQRYLDWLVMGPEGPENLSQHSTRMGNAALDDPAASEPDSGSIVVHGKAGGDSLDNYRQLLEQVPDRKQFKPSFSDALSAGIIGSLVSGGGHGLQTEQALMDQPYNEAMQAYKQRLEGSQHLVGLDQAQSTRDMAQANYARSLENDQFNHKNVLADNDRANSQFQNTVVNEINNRDETRAHHKSLEDHTLESFDETKRHNRSMEGIASTRENRLANGKNKKGTPKFVTRQEDRKADNDAIDSIIGDDPTLGKYFEKTEKGNWIMKGTGAEMNPGIFTKHTPLSNEERQALQKVIDKRKKELLGVTREVNEEE